MPPEPLNDLNALGHRRTEVLDAHRQVALIDIVRTHAHFDHVVHQLPHDVHAVVDSPQQHGLVAKRYARIRQLAAGFLGLQRDLLGVVEVRVEPNWMILLQHVDQVVRDPLRHDHRHPGANADDLDMWDFPKLLDDVFQRLVRHQQRVAARKEHVPDHRCVADVFNGLVDVVHRRLLVLRPREAPARTVTAIHGAHVRDQEQHPVRITVGQPRRWRVRVLVERVVHVRSTLMGFVDRRHCLHAYRTTWVILIHQGSVVWGDPHSEDLQGLFDPVLLLLGQVDDLLQVLQRRDPVADLPVPVVPLLLSDVFPKLNLVVILHSEGLLLIVGIFL